MGLEGKQVAVLAENNYQELELWYPYLRLKEAGAAVKIIGTGSAKSYIGKYGYPVDVDASAKEVSASHFDAIVIPGGYAPDLMRRDPAMVGLVKEAYEQGQVIAAICHAGWLLASAGILKGKWATSVSAIKDDMINAGAEWIDAEVVVEGNLITSRRPGDLPAFLREIIKALGGQR